MDQGEWGRSRSFRRLFLALSDAGEEANLLPVVETMVRSLREKVTGGGRCVCFKRPPPKKRRRRKNKRGRRKKDENFSFPDCEGCENLYNPDCVACRLRWIDKGLEGGGCKSRCGIYPSVLSLIQLLAPLEGGEIAVETAVCAMIKKKFPRAPKGFANLGDVTSRPRSDPGLSPRCWPNALFLKLTGREEFPT